MRKGVILIQTLFAFPYSLLISTIEILFKSIFRTSFNHSKYLDKPFAFPYSLLISTLEILLKREKGI